MKRLSFKTIIRKVKRLTKAVKVTVFDNNVRDFWGIFNSHTKVEVDRKLNILIFNWRDKRHRWAGGAEEYIHQLAKRWVKDGNNVTIFCGNDQRSPRNQVIDGIKIIRRGGFYTVYIWAFLYYIFKLRDKSHIIIDSENGIPFLTPLYVRKPILLLIHHVHQEIFHEFLSFPLNHIAAFVEGKLMPFIYKNKAFITVSESSKKEIIELAFTQKDNIIIIPNGVSESLSPIFKKTKHPSFVYLGRLKAYKNIDIAIRAFASIVKNYPTANLIIAGCGERKSSLKKLVHKLHLDNHVVFAGKVSEEKKVKLLNQSWAALQPSQVEGWGITVIESNACGTPVIASNVNGLKDSIVHGKTGILVKVKNVSQFAKAMELITENVELRKNLSREAHIWSQNFSWDKSANKLLEVIIKEVETSREYKPAGKLALQKAK